MSATSSALALADLAINRDASGAADLIMIDSDLASDRGLETAVLLSLFLDRRAFDDDKLPSGDARDKRGWWGDQFATVDGDLVGSRLWLLDRSVRSAENARKAEEYAREALDWMIQDRVVSAVGVTVDITGRDSMIIGVTLARPGRDATTFLFQHAWDHQT